MENVWLDGEIFAKHLTSSQLLKEVMLYKKETSLSVYFNSPTYTISFCNKTHAQKPRSPLYILGIRCKFK